MSFKLDNFEIGDRITGKIVKLEQDCVLVDFSTGELACVPLSELSCFKVETPEEILQCGEIREFLIVGNYDGKANIFFSHCLPETLMEDSDRLYEVALYDAFKQCGYPVSRENLIIDTKIRAVCSGGVSARIQWFLCSEDRFLTVSFSIRQLELKQAWERVRQLQAEDATIYEKILKKTRTGAIVKIEGLGGVIRTYNDKGREELIVGEEIPLKILDVRETEDCASVQLIYRSTLIRLRQLQVGQIISGTVRSIKNYGVFIDFGDLCALLLTSRILGLSVDHPAEVFKVGERLNATIVEIDIRNGRVLLESRGSLA